MHLLLSTIALRPYVFIFLASFLFIAIVNFGFRTTILFSLLTYAVSLACEWSSVHKGFAFVHVSRLRQLHCCAATEFAAPPPRHRSANSRYLGTSPRSASVADGRA